MARSSIFRTRALWKLLSACAELIDERRAVVPRCCFGHLEGRNNRVVRVSVDHVLNDGVVRLRLVPEARRDVSQNISHIKIGRASCRERVEKMRELQAE